MPYSEYINGKHHDYHFKQPKLRPGDPKPGYHYFFYVGTIFIGQIFRMSPRSWSTVSSNPKSSGPVRGFNSRLSACEYLLFVNGHREKD